MDTSTSFTHILIILPLIPVGCALFVTTFLLNVVYWFFVSKTEHIPICRESALSNLVQKSLRDDIGDRTVPFSIESVVDFFCEQDWSEELFSLPISDNHSIVALVVYRPIDLPLRLLVLLTVEGEDHWLSYAFKKRCQDRTEEGFALIKIVLPADVGVSEKPPVHVILRRVFNRIRLRWCSLSLNVCARGEAAAYLLQYLGEYGAAAHIETAVVVDPAKIAPVLLPPLPTVSKHSTVSMADDVTKRKLTNPVLRAVQQMDSFGSTSGASGSSSRQSSVVSTFDGLPETLDDIATPVFWFSTYEEKRYRSLFLNNIYFVLLENVSPFHVADRTVSFVSTVCRFNSCRKFTFKRMSSSLSLRLRVQRPHSFTAKATTAE